mmetsp:Transcript_104794/g.249518  ORF Transcript_104794/g.249518 Transcript_104794/m.249518 type:complete len:339 (+) Transcript_104794:3-1019(+)
MLLSAGLERSGLQRAHLEEELQRMERLLWERDQETARLRKQAQSLESSQLQLDMEMRGLQAARDNSALEAKELSGSIAELLHQRLQKVEKSKDVVDALGASPFSIDGAASQKESKRLHDVTQVLETKRQEFAELKHKTEQAAGDAKHWEAEESSLTRRVHLFEQELRAKQGQMEQNDKHFVHEGGLLREHIEELRKAVAKEQTGYMAADHRTALRAQVSEETHAAKREVQSLLAMVPQLDSALRARHQHVYSAEVKSDSIDVALHAVLRATPTPPGLVCRLGLADYVVGSDHVHLLAGPGGSLLYHLAGAAGQAQPLSGLLQHQAQQHSATAHPHQPF